MGCTSSISQEIILPHHRHLGKKKLSLEESRLIYHTNHEKFELIMLDPEIQKTFFNEKQNSEFIKFFEIFYGKYKSRFDKYNITYIVLKKIILEKIVESEIKDQFQYKEWNMKNFIFCCISKNNILYFYIIITQTSSFN